MIAESKLFAEAIPSASYSTARTELTAKTGKTEKMAAMVLQEARALSRKTIAATDMTLFALVRKSVN